MPKLRRGALWTTIVSGIRVALLTAVVAIAVSGVTTVGAQSGGADSVTISGSVSNGSVDGVVPRNFTVRLTLINSTTDVEIESFEERVDGDGNYSFEDIEIEDGYICRVTALAPIYTPSVDVDPCQTTQAPNLVIWEESDDLTNITVSLYNVIAREINGRTREILFQAVATIANQGDRIVRPNLNDLMSLTGLDLLRFNLPRGYSDLEVVESTPNGVEKGLLQTIPTGFALTTPIIPGNGYEISISFRVTYTGTEIVLPFRLPHGASNFNLLVPSGRASLMSSNVDYIQEVDVENDQIYSAYGGENFAPDTELGITLYELPQPVESQSTITISGSVSNGTEGADVPEDLIVRLVLIDLGGDGVMSSEAQRFEQTIDANNEYRFEEIPVSSNYLCRVVALAPAFTPFVDVDPCQTANVDDLVIWETTDDLAAITLNEYNVIVPIINAAERSILFLASVIVSNRGDRIWIPDIADPSLTGLDLLRFNLPEGYLDLAVEESTLPGVEEGIFQTIPTGFALTTPVPPGDEYRLLVSYGLTYEGTSKQIPYRLPHGADSFNLLIPVGETELVSGNVDYIEEVNITEDQAYASYGGTNYAPNTQLDITLLNLPQPGFLNRVEDFFTGVSVIWVVVIIASGILFMIIWVAWRRYLKRREETVEL